MSYADYAFGRYETEIAAVAEKYDLNLKDLEVESFSPGGLAIFVEKNGEKRFKIHINLLENRIIAVKQITAAPLENSGVDQFAKYRNFMK
jgi:hypothetical protein